MTWFPEDDLKIQYQRNNQWYEIHDGSQGQRSAALLAFLLAFGEEPIVLDQPEDDLDNHLIYDLIVRQIRENKLRRQLIVITHNANVVVNGDAELVHVMDFKNGQCVVAQSGVLQDKQVREEVCRVMEGGREAFASRWKRLGKEI
jgi:energy-coupling factor transporter ATP-binding protein EcfA2